jgi:nucleoid DNA-binding protein
MDKPISMSVKDYLIRVMAVKAMTSEKTIEAIVNHQFQSANEAMRRHNSLEISGFGKFFFNTKKAEKTMEKLLSKKQAFEKIIYNPAESEQRKRSASNKLANTLMGIEALTSKLNNNEPVPDIRGLEEQVDSPSRYEGED